jgi:antitoxin ParD1/3/4
MAPPSLPKLNLTLPHMPVSATICHIGGPITPNVHLTKPMQDDAADQIKSGAYANLSEIVRAGMRTLMEKDSARAFYLLEEVQAEAEAGDQPRFDIGKFR